MMLKKIKIYLILFLFVNTCFINSEIVTSSIALGATALGSVLYGAYRIGKCLIIECCDMPYIKTDIASNLQQEVEQRLYGQHLAQQVVIKAIRSHVVKEKPNKALVMSFHGWTGSGKNYLAKMIAKSIFKKGMNSKFVHMFVATYDFPHVHEVEKYKENLRSFITSNLSECGRSLFIFDEIDKMPLQLLDVIIPFIDFYDRVANVDPRKSIFLFLSNGAANSIAERTLEYYNTGRSRNDIAFKEMEEIIKTSAYNEGEGGLKTSRLITRHMIDYFIPFLPLERRHIIMCFKDYFRNRNISDVEPQQIEQLADSLHYFPKNKPIFSVAGCKQVEHKADFFFVDYHLDDEL